MVVIVLGKSELLVWVGFDGELKLGAAMGVIIATFKEHWKLNYKMSTIQLKRFLMNINTDGDSKKPQ